MKSEEASVGGEVLISDEEERAIRGRCERNEVVSVSEDGEPTASEKWKSLCFAGGVRGRSRKRRTLASLNFENFNFLVWFLILDSSGILVLFLIDREHKERWRIAVLDN